MDLGLIVVSSLATALLALLLYIAVDIYRLPKSRFFSWRDLVISYLMKRAFNILVPFVQRKFEKEARDFIKAQERFVLRQIRDNESSQYGKDHQFGRIHSLADFRRLHPVTSYSHYTSYVERAEQGDFKAILGKAKLRMFACSSGTTGKAKHIPVSSATNKGFFNMLGPFASFQPGAFSDGSEGILKDMQMMCVPRWRYSAAGTPIGPMSGMFMKNRWLMLHWSTPFEAVLVDTEAEAMYVSLLFGLRDRQLHHIEAGFSSGLFNMMQFLEANWRDLANDVRTGRLKDDLKVSAEHRAIINSYLRPDPTRASELELELQKGMDDILPRIFPTLSMIGCLSSGTCMALYRERCRRYIGHVPLLSLLYGCSEAFIAVNMRPAEQEPAYVLIPSMAFVEFLPVDESGSAVEDQQPLLADQVKVGEMYELIVTNCSGLYRYRMGDVVKVVDFYHQSPAVDFLFRAGQLLNVHMEKLSEESFYQALETAVGGWDGVTLLDFTCAESVLDPSPTPGAPYYLVFLELQQGNVSRQQTDMIDAALCEQNYVYKSFRVKDSIGPMKVVIVERDTFTAFRQFQFNTTTAFMNQFKQPRVLRNPKQVEFFLKHAT